MSGPAFLGGGGEDASGLAIARPRAEANTPETWVLGKRIVSLMGSTAEVERATVGATQQPLRRVEGASESGEGRPAPVDMGGRATAAATTAVEDEGRNAKVVVSPFEKRQAETPTLAPRKALKVSTSSTARWVVETQATIQCGAASSRADPKEPVTQGKATEAATKQAGEEAPTPHEAKAHESNEVEAPSVAEATEGEAEAPRTSETEVAEARTSRASEAEVVDARAPRATEAKAAEAGAPGTTEAEVAEAGLGAVEQCLTSVLPIQELEARSLGKSLFLQWERDIWDQLRQ
ncbi:uncharacterized protein [Miscanthus floridulus]|uniref:uncharacterized protein n=1 Tax=Miscanthus floridulus TaxID=154761 RepID=UPI0034590B49